MNSLELREVSHAFGRRWALRKISLQAKATERILLTGPNGAGKTTLLQILATLLTPSQGQVCVDGQPIDRPGESMRKRLGVLFMESFLYPQLTVKENLLFYARLYDCAAPDQVVETWLEQVGMQDFAHAHVSTLSRGERQRVSLARSLLHDPSILLWDEPTTGLDHQARELLPSIVQARPQSTLICVTHDPEFFRPWMTRFLHLEQGSLVA